MTVHALWSLYVPSQVVGTSLVYWSLYNGCDRDITVSSVLAVRAAPVVSTDPVGVQLFLTRTSAVAAGGTVASDDGTDLSACTISKIQQVALPTGIVAHRMPTSGGTAGAVICERQVVTEETLAQPGVEFLDTLLTVPEGTGIRVVQGAVASSGSIGFQVLFY